MVCVQSNQSKSTAPLATMAQTILLVMSVLLVFAEALPFYQVRQVFL
jgi:hypothetical protein